MATCRGCCKMGYPLSGGYCSGCRGTSSSHTCRVDRERGWNITTKIEYDDPPALQGDLPFDVKKSLGYYYPFRRMPQTLCDCADCKLYQRNRRDTGDLGHHSCRRYYRDGCIPGQQSTTPQRTPAYSSSPSYPGASTSPRRTRQQQRRKVPTHRDVDDYTDDRPVYERVQDAPPREWAENASRRAHHPREWQEDAYDERAGWDEGEGVPQVAAGDDPDEVAYQKLWSAFRTIRSAVIEQQEHASQRRDREVAAAAAAAADEYHGEPEYAYDYEYADAHQAPLQWNPGSQERQRSYSPKDVSTYTTYSSPAKASRCL